MSDSIFNIQLTNMRPRDIEWLAQITGQETGRARITTLMTTMFCFVLFFNLQCFLTIHVTIKYIRIAQLLFSFGKSLYVYRWLATICYSFVRICYNSISTILLFFSIGWVVLHTRSTLILIPCNIIYKKTLSNIKCYSWKFQEKEN